MLTNDNTATLYRLLEAARRAPANSGDRQALVKQVMEELTLYTLLKEQTSDNRDRAHQLKAQNWLIWLDQEAKG